MSRHSKSIGKHIVVYYGSDHIIGKFIDITDRRYANSSKDEQGEGYVFEHSDLFPTKNKKVILDPNKPLTDEMITDACDEFITKLKDDEEE